MRNTVRTPPSRRWWLAAAGLVALAGNACGKKESPGSGSPGAATEVPSAPEPAKPGDLAADRRTSERPAPGATPEAPVAVPAEAAAGGAAVWISAPNLARSVERVAALVDALRAGGGELAAELPPGDVLRAQGEQVIRFGPLAELLGLPDPSAVDLARPLRLRVSFPASGEPLLVVSLGTTRPLEPLRAGKLVGVPSADGRYLVGIGVEPDATAAWPPDEPDRADEDLVAVVDLRRAAPALVKLMQDLQGMATRMGGAEPIPPWLGGLGEALVDLVVEVSGIEKMTMGMKLGAGPSEAPLRMTFGFRGAPDSPLAAVWPALVEGAPAFGLLETVDAGSDMWIAARMNPVAAKRLADLSRQAVERFIRRALGPEWQEPLLNAYDAMIDSLVATDGRTVVGTRVLPDGRSAFTGVWGVTEGGTACRDALRRSATAFVDLAKMVSDKYALGTTVAWEQNAARSGDVEVDRLTIVVPRTALGAFAAALQPGEGDLRWEISLAVGRTTAVITTDTDAGVLRRALAGQARGGGIAGGSPLLTRIRNPEPGLLELGALDMAASFRGNPALACPAGTAFPPLPLHLDVSIRDGVFAMAMDFLPGSLGSVLPFVQAMTACAAATPTPAVGAGLP